MQFFLGQLQGHYLLQSFSLVHYSMKIRDSQAI
jgi:hypothetical protein